MTCQFCGRQDDQIGNMELHYRKHTIEALLKISKSVETLSDILDERLPAMNWKNEKVELRP